jgi:cell division protein FtsN
MTPPDDPRMDGPEHDLYDETPPRSIFAATWFRALLVLIVLGVVGAVAVPYILDAMNPPPKPTAAARTAPSPAPPAIAIPTAPDKMASADKPAPAEKPAPADKLVADKPVPDKPAPPERMDKPAADKPLVEKPSPARKPAAGAAPEPKPKTAAKLPAAAKPDEAATAAAKPAPAPKRAAARGTAASAPKGAATGEWWVQVGAFRDHDAAKKLAAKLREQSYTVEESVRGAGESAAKPAAAEKPAPAAAGPAPAAADQYDVFVSGLSADELNKRLAAKGLAAAPSGGGAVIKPSLPLRDAVALSKDLAVDGFKVHVRRAGSAAPEPAPRPASDRPAEPTAGGGGETLYRVRVGAFPDRATAMTTLKELEGKGYKGYVARGGP